MTYRALRYLAPNAIILLNHLCYASGNSEPGHAAPTMSVAKQRVDNYAAGFLRSPARAVLADGQRGPADTLRRMLREKSAGVSSSLSVMWITLHMLTIETDFPPGSFSRFDRAFSGSHSNRMP